MLFPRSYILLMSYYEPRGRFVELKFRGKALLSAQRLSRLCSLSLVMIGSVFRPFVRLRKADGAYLVAILRHCLVHFWKS